MSAKQDLQKNEGRLRKDINEAQKASQVYESEPFQTAKQTVLDDIYRAFMTTPAHDVVTLQALRFEMEVAAQFFTQFERIIETGKMSRNEMDSLIEREKAERFGRQFKTV